EVRYIATVDLLRVAVLDQLRVHPRVAQQPAIPLDASVRSQLLATLPPLVPFAGRAIVDVIAVLDWDHRIPSRRFTLRLHAFYDVASRERFERAFGERAAAIGERDLYPEFDVPDFAEL